MHLEDGVNANMVGTLTEDITGILSEQYDEAGTWNDSYKYEKDILDESGNVVETKILDVGDAYAYILVLGGIIIYTFIFAVKYLKREFTIIFLILLGPVSCITYPIDKISDGKAQAFNRWFSEFLYQVIVQPFHLLLYIVLVGSAAQLADANVIYALVCFAVMIPAEKFIKEMFGFKDKLGSPLGAMASTALATKALGSLMNKGKGSSGAGGKDEGSDNNSTPNELPPKTVDKPGLVDGMNSEEKNIEREEIRQQDNQTLEPEEETEGRVGQQDNKTLESGEEPGGNASVADAYQNSDDPVADAKRAALEEQIADGQLDEDDLTDEQRALLKKERNDEQTENDADKNDDNTDNDANKDDEEKVNEGKLKKLKNKAIDTKNKIENSKAMAIHNQRVSKKYGSTNRKQRWKRRIAKGAKAGIKGALKGGAIGLVGTAAMAGALMTGNGKEALGIAAGIGAYAGNKALNSGKKVIKGAKGAINDYRNGLSSNESKEKKALKNFKADRKQVDKAVLSYRKNHKGKDPGYKELEKEMEDRFALSRYGLSDDQIDSAIDSFQELRDDKNVPEKDALNQTAYAAKLADDYSKKDFRSEKTMKEAVSTIADNFESYGVPRELAEQNAEKYLRQAAGIKGVEIALPSTNKTVDIDIPARQSIPNVTGLLGLESVNMTSNQLERINNITVRLHRAGFNKGEIERIASNSAGGSITEVLNKYEANVQYLGNENAQEEARMLIESKNNGRNATTKQVQEEMKERLILKSTFNVSNEKDISALRELETTEVKGKTQIQAAREFAIENKGRLNDTPHMQKAKENLVEKLKLGGSSRDKARKDAENIINLAVQYNDEIKYDKGVTKQKRK